MTRDNTSLGEIARVFLKLGTIAFGGPAAHIAMMEDEVVRRRAWLSREEFLDYLGATNLIPGPNSTELAIHVGHALRGWRGLLVAGACFILPATLIVAAIAWAYVKFGTLPAAGGILSGVKPVVIVVVIQAVLRLGRSAVKTWPLAVIGIAAVAAEAFGVNEIAVLLVAGIVAALFTVSHRQLRALVTPSITQLFPWRPHDVLRASAIGGTAIPLSLWPLFTVFVKIGAVLFGSGYVLLAFLRADLVERLGWLSERQLLDAIAVGQVTPGPVFTTATFIGYVLQGVPGAAVATVGIFLPAFFFVAVSGPLVPRLRASKLAGAVLDGVNVASLALMVVVTYQLAGSALRDALAVAIAIVSAVLLFAFRANSAWLVAGGAIAGLLLSPG